jgi:hypothetical protein
MLHVITVIDPNPNVGDDHLVTEFVSTSPRSVQNKFREWCEEQFPEGIADIGLFVVIGPRAIDVT